MKHIRGMHYVLKESGNTLLVSAILKGGANDSIIRKNTEAFIILLFFSRHVIIILNIIEA